MVRILPQPPQHHTPQALLGSHSRSRTLQRSNGNSTDDNDHIPQRRHLRLHLQPRRCNLGRLRRSLHHQAYGKEDITKPGWQGVPLPEYNEVTTRLTQQQLCDLYQTGKPNVIEHTSIYLMKENLTKRKNARSKGNA